MPELFCSNADCKRLLTDFELVRICNKKTVHSKYRYCVKCRTKSNNIDTIRCNKCKYTFSYQGSIFQVICKSCLEGRT